MNPFPYIMAAAVMLIALHECPSVIERFHKSWQSMLAANQIKNAMMADRPQAEPPHQAARPVTGAAPLPPVATVAPAFDLDAKRRQVRQAYVETRVLLHHEQTRRQP